MVRPPKAPPPWVRWIAQDADGAWWGYSVEPLAAHDHWYENEVGRYIALGRGAANPEWESTLRQVYPEAWGRCSGGGCRV